MRALERMGSVKDTEQEVNKCMQVKGQQKCDKYRVTTHLSTVDIYCKRLTSKSRSGLTQVYFVARVIQENVIIGPTLEQGLT